MKMDIHSTINYERVRVEKIVYSPVNSPILQKGHILNIFQYKYRICCIEFFEFT